MKKIHITIATICALYMIMFSAMFNRWFVPPPYHEGPPETVGVRYIPLSTERDCTVQKVATETQQFCMPAKEEVIITATNEHWIVNHPLHHPLEATVCSDSSVPGGLRRYTASYTACKS